MITITLQYWHRAKPYFEIFIMWHEATVNCCEDFLHELFLGLFVRNDIDKFKVLLLLWRNRFWRSARFTFAFSFQHFALTKNKLTVYLKVRENQKSNQEWRRTQRHMPDKTQDTEQRQQQTTTEKTKRMDNTNLTKKYKNMCVCLLAFNATFINISVICWPLA